VPNQPGITQAETYAAWLKRDTAKLAASKPEAFSLSLPVAKFDDQNGIVTGWAALSSADGEPLIDFHNELLLVSELEKTAHGLMIDGGAGKAGEMHADRVGDVVESMVISKEKAAALGLGDVKTEGWVVSMKLRDPGAIARVKNGERSELSIHGNARKIPVGERNGSVVKALVDLSVDEISIVDHGASGSGDDLPKIVIAKRKEQDAPKSNKGLGKRFISQVMKIFGKVQTMNLDDVLAELDDEKRAVILAAIEAAAQPAAPAAAPAAPVVVAEPVAPVANAEGDPAPEPKKDEEEEMAKVMKSLPEAIRKRLEDAEDVKKRLDDIEERTEVAKFRSKAENLPFLAGESTDEIAKVMRVASGSLKPEEYATFEKLLGNRNEALKNHPLFDDKGGRGNDAEMTAKGKFEAIAKKLQESDPKLTKEQAVAKAIKDPTNRELYQEYTAEVNG